MDPISGSAATHWMHEGPVPIGFRVRDLMCSYRAMITLNNDSREAFDAAKQLVMQLSEGAGSDMFSFFRFVNEEYEKGRNAQIKARIVKFLGLVPCTPSSSVAPSPTVSPSKATEGVLPTLTPAQAAAALQAIKAPSAAAPTQQLGYRPAAKLWDIPYAEFHALLHQGKLEAVIKWAQGSYPKALSDQIEAIVRCPRSFIEKIVMIEIEIAKHDKKDPAPLRTLLEQVSLLAGFFEGSRRGLGSEEDVKLSDITDHAGNIPANSKYVSVTNFGTCRLIVFNTSGSEKFEVFDSGKSRTPSCVKIEGVIRGKQKMGMEAEIKEADVKYSDVIEAEVKYSISIDLTPDSHFLYFGKPTRSQRVEVGIHGTGAVDVMGLDERPKGAKGSVKQDRAIHLFHYERAFVNAQIKGDDPLPDEYNGSPYRVPDPNANNGWVVVPDPAKVNETHLYRGIPPEMSAELRKATRYYQLGEDNVLIIKLGCIKGLWDQILPPHVIRYLKNTDSEDLCLTFDKTANKWRHIRLVDPVELGNNVRVLTSQLNDAWRAWDIPNFWKDHPEATANKDDRMANRRFEHYIHENREPAKVKRYVNGMAVLGFTARTGKFISTTDHHFVFGEDDAKIVHGSTGAVVATLPCTISAKKSDPNNPRMKTVDEILERISAGDMSIEEPNTNTTIMTDAGGISFQVNPDLYLTVSQEGMKELRASITTVDANNVTSLGASVPCKFNKDTFSIDSVPRMPRKVLGYTGVSLRGNNPHLFNGAGKKHTLQRVTDFPLYPRIMSISVIKALAAETLTDFPKEVTRIIAVYAAEDGGAYEAESVFVGGDHSQLPKIKREHTSTLMKTNVNV